MFSSVNKKINRARVRAVVFEPCSVSCVFGKYDWQIAIFIIFRTQRTIFRAGRIACTCVPSVRSIGVGTGGAGRAIAPPDLYEGERRSSNFVTKTN